MPYQGYATGASRDQQEPDDTDGLLGIVTTMGEGVEACRYQLSTHKPASDLMGRSIAEHPGGNDLQGAANQEADQGGEDDEGQNGD